MNTESGFDLPDTSDRIKELERRADSHVEAVREKLRQRAAVGLAKYGVTTERPDLAGLDWLRHAQEEAMDLAVYLEAAIARFSNNQQPPINPS